MRRNKLTATLLGIGTAATLLLPASGAFADPGWGRPGGPKVRIEKRHDDRHDRRDDRRDAYRYGYKDGRRDDRRDAYRYGYKDGHRDDRRDNRRDGYRPSYRDNRRDDRHGCERRSDTGRDLGLVIGGAVLGAVIANHR